MFALKAYPGLLIAVCMAVSACSGSNRPAEQAGTDGAIGAEGIIASSMTTAASPGSMPKPARPRPNPSAPQAGPVSRQ
jgi:hypothetical protein